MAEAFYNHFTHTENAVSAGILDFTPAKYGHPISEVVTVMNEEGIDVSKKIVKTVTEKMSLEADHIYVLCKREECPAFLLKEERKITFWKINDPFGSSIGNFRLVRDQIKALVKSIIV